MTQPSLTAQIARELYIAMERLSADPELLSIVSSYGDTLDDEEILALLQEYNATGQVLHQPQQGEPIANCGAGIAQRRQPSHIRCDNVRSLHPTLHVARSP